MDTKHIVLTGFIVTALVTAVVLVDVLPVLVIAFIILLAGLGFTYYAGLSRNRIEYIGEQRLLLEFNKHLSGIQERSEVELITNKYASRIVSCEKTMILGAGDVSTIEDGFDVNSIKKWVEEKKAELLIVDHNSCPPDLSVPAHIQSLLAIPILSRSDIYGIILLLNKKDPGSFTARQREMLQHLAAETAEIISQLLDYKKQQAYQLDLLKAMVKAIEEREMGFAGHSERVAEITRLLGGKLGLDAAEMQDLYYSALLHDIGKLRLDCNDNSEANGLNLEGHASQGAYILQEVPGIERVREGILYHHERYDGKGGPQGLAATDIPFAARIIAVADIYDALTRLCAEEERLSHKESLRAIKKCSGSILDPLVVVALEEVEDIIAGWDQCVTRGRGY